LTDKIDLYELAKKPFFALKKYDGSFAIHYQYKDKDYIATKGSFSSEQAQWATKWFREHIRSSEMLKTHTYLFEMIYPENKIVVDYGDTEDLVLLGVINKETGEEMSYAALKEEGKRIGATVAEAKEFNSLDELYAHCKGLPATEEGFVVNFHNGLKVKIKGDEYCKIHRILAHMTPLAFWNAWDLEEKDIPKGFMVVMPEEFREITDLLYKQIYALHWDAFNKIEESYMKLMERFSLDIDHKTLYLTGKELYPDQINEMMFYHKEKFYKLWLGIHRRVRPTFNVLPDSVAGVDRLKRILEET
jgi:RNA ligase